MKKLVIYLTVFLAALIVFMSIQLSRETNRVSEQNKIDWQEYKTRCEELGGIASKQFAGYRCDR